MHTLKINIQDNVFDKVIYFLQNLPKNEVEIISDTKEHADKHKNDISDTKAFSNHSANHIDEWKDSDEDSIWK